MEPIKEEDITGGADQGTVEQRVQQIKNFESMLSEIKLSSDEK